MLKINKLEGKNKRLRKKLYLGEFKVLGFRAEGKLGESAPEKIDELVDGLIDLIESRHLYCCGGLTQSSIEFYFYSIERYGSPTDDDVKAVRDYLQSNPAGKELVCSELFDANYGE